MRSLSIFALLVSAASFASASTISFVCTSVSYLGQNGSGQSLSCPTGFTAPSGSSITNVSYDYTVDFQFNNFQAGTKAISANLDALGANDVSGLSVTQANRPQGGSVNVLAGDWAAFAAGPVSIATSYTGASTAVTGATFDAQVTFTYEAQSTVPEPSTLALVGGVLVLAGIRKFRS